MISKLKVLGCAAALLVSSNVFAYAIGTPWDKEGLFRSSGLDEDMSQCVAAFVGEANKIVSKLGYSELESINLKTLNRSSDDQGIVEMSFNVKVKAGGLLFFPIYKTDNYSLTAEAPNVGCLGGFEVLQMEKN